MALELADIFHTFAPAYRQKYAAKLLPSHGQAMRAIERCRTETLGGQVFTCSACGETRYSYHSCRNRHCPATVRGCPKCQHEQTQQWLAFQQKLLLPVPYFFLTFTLPAELRQFASSNQKLVYNLLFQASAQAAQRLAKDPRLVGGQIGLIGVLHTWTRNLLFHPHVHYLTPGGGLEVDGLTWHLARKRFFLPVKALSKLFRAAFQHALKNTPLYPNVPAKVWRKKWVVHCKPVGNGQAALKYLAPYIHRVALSNRRLLSLSQGSLEIAQVVFQYRASGTGQLKRCSLSAEKFIQRFLQHVLPRGFVKVRYFGFFGSTCRKRLAFLQQLLVPIQSREKTVLERDTVEPKITDHPIPPLTHCPKCGGTMIFLRTISPRFCRSP